MSLNGLDNATVKEAHEGATAEAGGWFLLSYSSRDEVDVYKRGTGGVAEMRNAIAEYEEKSPLYGFLRYRRRNVLVKYQPEDCSRLIQARATVHFNAFSEAFTHNSTFDITTAKELKDSKLSAACSLHAASGSSSSSTSSLRRRRLMEITEEDEEEERERKRQSIVQEERPGTSEKSDETATPLSPPSSPPERPAFLDRDQLNLPQKSLDFASTSEAPTFQGDARPPSSSNSDYNLSENRRHSSQTVRPDLYSYSSYPYGKPKVKLGPRPSLDTNKRPQTAGTYRPVAALPAGFKLTSKGSRRGRPHDKSDSEDLENEHGTTGLSTPAPIIESSKENEATLLPPRPATSSGASIKSMSALSTYKDNKISPEKARLMKAMKLREKKKKMSMISPDPTPVAAEFPASVKESLAEDDESAANEEKVQESEKRMSDSHADSGILMDLPTPITVNTETTNDDIFTDSRPPSPTITSSEVGESTKASSLSDSTDETVMAAKQPEEQNEDASNEVTGNPINPENADEVDIMSESSPEETISSAPVVASSSTPESEQEPKPLDKVQSETSDSEVQISAQNSDSIVGESKDVPNHIEELATPAEIEDIRESIETDDLPEETSDIRTQEVEAPATTEEVSSPKSPYGIPISKFSSHEAKSPTATTPRLKSKFSTQDLKTPPTEEPPVPSITAAIADDQPAEEPTLEISIIDSPPAKRSGRKPLTLPLHTKLAQDTPESELSDPLLDDDLMDELQAATVEEAMVASKTPITSVFPSTSPTKLHHLSRSQTMPRAFSNPIRGQLLAPGDVSSSSARSVSAGGAAFLHNITRQPSNASLSAKKGMGSSISQRIKALEERSTKGGEELLRPRTATPSSNFISVRKQGSREASRSPSVYGRTNNLNAQSPTPEQSREGSPETPVGLRPRSRSGSVASRLSIFEAGGALPPRGRPDSIQVTARIVRDPSQIFPKKPSHKDPSDYSAADLRQSTLVVDHVKAELDTDTTAGPAKLPVKEAPRETLHERRLSKAGEEKAEKRRSSLSVVKDFIKDHRTSISSRSTDNLAIVSPTPSSARSPSQPPSSHHNVGSSIARRLSVSSRRSSFSRDREITTPVMSPGASTEPSSGDEDRSSLGDKKSKSRTSRFMRRLSNSLVATRKNLTPSITPTVREEEDEVVAVPSAAKVRNAGQPTMAAYMGDVNVQFPDNLLWKRRSLCLDTQGFLILSAVQGAAVNGTEKTGVKRYHLSDFRTPYIPDVDVQELPNSIVLDFVGGSGLQLACEGPHGQKDILKALQEAHSNHGSFGN
ncbi:hypothetical protein BX600DRAFT_259819 [Xylariales sp. PMI_506]|nr:hypothetical protein BX600DRAFT_259819 [Xylariales sp. PMI_506]